MRSTKKKTRKPRTAIHRIVNKLLARFGKKCEWWDDGCPECVLPFCGKNDDCCQGNPFICKKLYLRYLASAKKVDKRVIDEFERREKNSRLPEK